MEVILIILVAIALIYSIEVIGITGDFFNPAFLFILPITLSVICHCIYYAPEYHVSDMTYVIYSISVLCFCIGLFITMGVGKSKCSENTSRYENKYNGTIFNFYLLLMVFGAILSLRYLRQAMQFTLMGDSLLSNIRYYSLFVSQKSGLAKYGIVFAQTVMNYALYVRIVLGVKTKQIRRIIFLSAFCLLCSISTSLARTTLLSIILQIIFIISLSISDRRVDKSRRKKNTIRILVIGIVLFIAFNFIASRTGKLNMGGRLWIVSYLGEEIKSFDKYVLHYEYLTGGTQSLGILGRVFSKLGFGQSAEVDAYNTMMTLAGGPVSSFAAGPYMDFGIVGSIVIMLFYGMAIGYIYIKHLYNGGIWTLAYSTCTYQCAIAFFAFQFGMSDQIYYLILMFLLLRTRFGSKENVVLDYNPGL